MTIEEKARAYDEALEKAKEFKNNPFAGYDGTDLISALFPELKESEDEKIRKALLGYIKGVSKREVCKETLNEWIAWLEKQREQKPMKVYRVENEAEQKGLWRKFDGTWQPLFDMLTDGKCKDMPMEDSPIYRDGGKRWFASAPSKETLQKWFSKRDLEELVSKGFTISEFEVVGYKKVSNFEYIFTRDNIINRNYLEVSDIYSEQKDFAPKIEPKFKVGDTVKDPYGEIYHIIKIDDNSYKTDDGRFILFENEDAYSLWTIQDAKDGDILCSNQIIVLFKQWEDNTDYSFVIAHAGIDVSGKLQVTDGHWLINNKSKPATKEQRDTLFKAMADAGYTFDFEKKELRKIEQKSVWSKEDERICCAIVNDIAIDKTMCKYEISRGICDEQINWLKSLKDRVQPQPKQKWNKEDEDILNTIINHFEIDLECTENDDIIRWLKSLNPQPKQKWSEEDEKKLLCICAWIKDYPRIADFIDEMYTVANNYITWLESLNPHNRWKPNEGQLECLGYAIEKAEKDWSPPTNNRVYLTLKALKEQLEKL